MNQQHKRLLFFLFSTLYLVFISNADLYSVYTNSKIESTCCSEIEVENTCCKRETDKDCCQPNSCCHLSTNQNPQSISNTESKIEIISLKNNSKKEGIRFDFFSHFFSNTVNKIGSISDFFLQRRFIVPNIFHNYFSFISTWRC